MYLLVATILSLNPVFSDSCGYIAYYNQCNSAEEDYWKGNYAEALRKTQAAFGLVPYVHTRQLLLGARIAARNNDDKLTYRYLKQAFLEGIKDTEVAEYDDFGEFRKSRLYKKLEGEYPKLHGEYESHINTEFSDQLDSLYYIDQYISRKSESPSERVYAVNAELYKGKNLDSLIFASLRGLIDMYGFPSERTVRRKSLQAAYVILHHNVRLTVNEVYLQRLKGLLEVGLYNPFWYAWAYDQNLMFFRKKKCEFYCGVPIDRNKLDGAELIRVDDKRREIGLESLALERLRE